MSNRFDENWCKASDSGLPKPHLVIYMDIAPERSAQRAGFGQELYEKVDFQKKVHANFKKLQEENWVLVNADQSIDKVFEEILAAIEKFKPTKNQEVQNLWKLDN